MDDVDFLICRLRCYEVRGEFEPFAQTERSGLLGDEGIGAGFDEKVIDPFGCDGSTKTK